MIFKNYLPDARNVRYKQNRERFLGIWASSWAVYVLRLPISIFLVVSEKSKGMIILDHTSSLLSGILFLWGTYAFLNRKMPKGWTYGFVLGAIWIVIAVFGEFSFFYLAFPTFTFIGLVSIWTGIVFIRSEKFEGIGKHITGWSFIGWGVLRLNYAFLTPITWLTPWLYLTASILALFIAVGILLVYFQRIKSELNKSEQKYCSLIRNIPDVTWTAVCDGNITFISPNVKDVCLYSPEEMYRANPGLKFDMIHPGDIERVKKAWDLLFAEKKKYDVEYRIKRKDGQWIWIHEKAIATYQKGGVTYADGVFSDNTGRKQAEEDRLQRKKLKGVPEMAGAVCHELNQPLQAIVGYSQLLMMDGKGNESLRKRIDKINAQVEKISGITGKLMKITKYKTREYLDGKIIDIDAASKEG